jgi:hypothetical protein
MYVCGYPPAIRLRVSTRYPQSGPQHSVRRLLGSGQVQCTSWRNFAPFSSSTFKNIHGEQAGKRDRGGSTVGARHIVREHDTTQPVLNKDIKRAQSQTAPGVPRIRMLGVKVLLRAGARRTGEKLAPSPARPSFDPDHALPFVLSPHFRRGFTKY